MNKLFNCGTLNVRGIETDEERTTIAKDAVKYKLQKISITETHLTEDTQEEITIHDENGKR